VTGEPNEPVAPAPPPPPVRADWADLPDEALLDVRLCELGLTIEGSWLEERLADLQRELDARGLTFRPHYWLSAEWFSPDGVPGVAIPFYLAHPRLMRLERTQMLEVEGGTPETCMQILRHEAGHAFDNAYELRRRRPAGESVRIAVGGLPRLLPATALLEELRAASGQLVRAEPPGRRLCGNIRRLAHARTPIGARDTPTGRRRENSSTWTS
jgi:hypothetical protein